MGIFLISPTACELVMFIGIFVFAGTLLAYVGAKLQREKMIQTGQWTFIVSFALVIVIVLFIIVHFAL